MNNNMSREAGSASGGKTVAVSGGFDPLHIGHVEMMREAKALGDRLVVIINNDNWLIKKKGFAFMPESERKAIIEALRCVDEVVISSHPENPSGAAEMSVSKELEKIKPDIFANGGDRDEKNASDPNSSLYHDIETCKKLGIEMVFNVGHSGKIQSSSDLVRRAHELDPKAKR
jgi:cytidyltransferase-like protein